jgi:threonine aldolase
MAARGFGSDNHAGALPEVLAAMGAVNEGHAGSYGHDEDTERVEALFGERFGPGARTFFVFNGSGANVVAMRAMCKPWEAVICTQAAHMEVDECGAPEAIAGVKLLTVAAPDGKLTPDLITRRIARVGDEHAAQARVVSVTQTTELGTLYSLDELAAITATAREHGLLVHMDGARFLNAAEALGCSFADLARGVDILSFGGTKAGMVFGEAIVVLRPELADGMPYLRKQTLQLASKMRFVAAQFEALLRDDAGLRAVGNANAMARRLAAAIQRIDGVRITQAVQANVVFAILPPEATERLQRDWRFYTWDEHTGEVRWMCAWDTTADDVDAFAAAVADAVGAAVA